LGSSSTRPDKTATEKLTTSAHILNALDADGAGEKETGGWWRDNYPDAERWPVPEGKDPGEAWKAGVNIREWVMEGLPEGMRKSGAKRLDERPANAVLEERAGRPLREEQKERSMEDLKNHFRGIE
jgi:hypothetical protein